MFSNFLNKLHTILRITVAFHWIYKPFIFNIFFKFPNHLLKKEHNLHLLTPLVTKLKEIKCPSESTESLTSRWKVLIFFLLFSSLPRYFFRCRFFVLFGWTFACYFLGRGHRIFLLSRCRRRKRFLCFSKKLWFISKRGKTWKHFEMTM